MVNIFRSTAPSVLILLAFSACSYPKHHIGKNADAVDWRTENSQSGWPGQGDQEVERIRRFIIWRESRGNYAAVDKKQRWFGAYQFAVRTSDVAARRMKRPDLLGIPANQWSQKDQDAAFYVMFDNGRGRQHWAGPMRKFRTTRKAASASSVAALTAK